MIEILSQSTNTCLVVHLSGRVTLQDYQQFMDALAERLKTGAPVSLVADLSGFELYEDLDVAKKDLKFAFGDYKHIHRAAYVGDQKWLVWFTRLMGPFTRAEEKHFPHDQFQVAYEWACA
jgi:hypothetical protein